MIFKYLLTSNENRPNFQNGQFLTIYDNFIIGHRLMIYDEKHYQTVFCLCNYSGPYYVFFFTTITLTTLVTFRQYVREKERFKENYTV